MGVVRTLAVLALCALLAACASGPTLSEVKPDLAGPAEDTGRIYFYRTSVFGAAVQPPVYLNDEEVGHSVPRGVFYKDVEPGKYRVHMETEVERRLTFTIDAGETVFELVAGGAGLAVVDRQALVEKQPLAEFDALRAVLVGSRHRFGQRFESTVRALDQ